MGRPKLYHAWNIPKSVVDIVKTLCADYPRRKKSIERGECSGRILDEYERINNAIDLSISDIEDGMRDRVLSDLVSGVGYDFSQSSVCVGKNQYYKIKRKRIYTIAVGLILVE